MLWHPRFSVCMNFDSQLEIRNLSKNELTQARPNRFGFGVAHPLTLLPSGAHKRDELLLCFGTESESSHWISVLL